VHQQGFFQAYIHDIKTPSDFTETRLSPLRDASKVADEDPVTALLRDARQQYESWRSSQDSSSHSRHPAAQRRPRVDGQQCGLRTSNPERQGPLREPRPYYYRLQRNLSAR